MSIPLTVFLLEKKEEVNFSGQSSFIKHKIHTARYDTYKIYVHFSLFISRSVKFMKMYKIYPFESLITIFNTSYAGKLITFNSPS